MTFSNDALRLPAAFGALPVRPTSGKTRRQDETHTGYPMTTLNDEILADRQRTWNGVSKLLLWGTIESLVLTLVTVLFAINGPSLGMFVFGFGAIVIVSAIVLAKIVGGK
jgi:transglutaminase-like putative cysteine protease